MRDANFLKSINRVHIIRLLLFIEIIWGIVAVYVYYKYPVEFKIYFFFLFVVNFLTLLPFPQILKEEKNNNSEEENSNYQVLENRTSTSQYQFGLWEQSCVGFYAIVNSLIIILVLFLISTSK